MKGGKSGSEAALDDFLAGLGPSANHGLPFAPLGALGRTVVELGCGEGAFLEKALAHIEGWSCAFGIDPDFGSIVRSSERFREDMRVSFMQAPAERLPLRSGCADVVLISKALHHMEFPAAAISEARRILRDSGSLAICEQASDGLPPEALRWEEYHRLRGRIESARGSYMRPIYSSLELDRLLSEGGFSRVRGSLLGLEDMGADEAWRQASEGLSKALEGMPGGARRDGFVLEADALLGRIKAGGASRPPLYLSEWEKRGHDEKRD
jgi:SAM-dependent methyltransferase